MITILIGISGSGKTTLAKARVVNSKKTMRVNRDDLRRTLFMMDGTYYQRPDLRECEKLVSEVSEQMIYDGLHKGMDIVIDNTNLQRKYIDEIIRKFNHLASIEIVFVEISLVTAKERVLHREGGSIDVSYIDRQFNDLQKLKKQLHGNQLFYPQINAEISFNQKFPEVYLVDIDGTIAKKGDRDIFDDSKLHLDTEIVSVGNVVRGIEREGFRIIYVSGRQDSCYDTTKKWLEDNNLWFDKTEMYMRKTGDLRPDYLIKEEIVVNDIHPKYNVIGVLDDRLQVTREYFRLGIPVLNCNQNLIQF